MSGNKRQNRLMWAMGVALLVALMAVGELTARRAQALPDDTYRELQTFANVLAIVQKNYVEPVSTKRLVNGAIIGMLASLDPHSAYLTPDLLGGGRTVMVGNLVQNQFTTARDWPFGAAVSIALMALVTLLLAVYLRRQSEPLA